MRLATLVVVALLVALPGTAVAQVDAVQEPAAASGAFESSWWDSAVQRSMSHTLAEGGAGRLRWRASADAWSLEEPAGLSYARLRGDLGGDRLGGGLSYSARLQLSRRLELWLDAQAAVDSGYAYASARAGLVWWFARRVGLIVYASVSVGTDLGSEVFVPSTTSLDRGGYDDMRRRRSVNERNPMLPAALQGGPVNAGAGVGLVTRER